MPLELDGILERFQKQYSPTKKVEFPEDGLTFILSTVPPDKEIQIAEYIKDFEGIDYFEKLKIATLAHAITKINDIDLNVSTIEIPTQNGTITKEKQIYLREKIEKWHSSLRNQLFIAYENLQAEIENRVNTSIKFKRFEPPKVEIEKTEEKFKEVKPDMTPVQNEQNFRKIDINNTEAINEIVKKEQEMVETGLNG